MHSSPSTFGSFGVRGVGGSARSSGRQSPRRRYRQLAVGRTVGRRRESLAVPMGLAFAALTPKVSPSSFAEHTWPGLVDGATTRNSSRGPTTSESAFMFGLRSQESIIVLSQRHGRDNRKPEKVVAREHSASPPALKTKLAPSDLHRLVHNVRRRVEHEVTVTFEGTERKVDFHTTLLPQTPETTQHIFTQGGYTSTSQLPPRSSAKKDPFMLLDETREIISSPGFACVFEARLDRATEMLLSSVESAVFASSTDAVGPGEEVRIRLPGLLPGLARWSHLALNGLPKELVDLQYIGCTAGRGLECDSVWQIRGTVWHAIILI
ncbi:hypothetical protein DFH07DRAFT_840405 [Mycena maculata]|uniref:Uncharacterized protein n=1 Tax=Mycena maculata TaxID=230809 RepID=A0AAD7ICT1_9AGAR|nr:hypothetical protein DFH07DRAFT_840405 [Mycena maculata]